MWTMPRCALRRPSNSTPKPRSFFSSSRTCFAADSIVIGAPPEDLFGARRSGVIHGGQGEVGAAYRQAPRPQDREGLRRSHFVDQVQIDYEDSGRIGASAVTWWRSRPFRTSFAVRVTLSIP